MAIAPIATESSTAVDATQVRTAVELTAATSEESEFATSLALDVWSERTNVGTPMVIVVDQRGLAELNSRGISARIVVADIDAVARAEKARLANRARVTDGGSWFTEYRDVMEVREFMDRLANAHPDLARLRRLGASVEGWPIRAVEIGRGGPIHIALNGGQHAREWIAVMVPLCIADRLARGDATNPATKELLDSVTFTIAPLINPDGYAHSWSADRYWRKNRRGGHGVDLNRNYSVAWGKRGSSGSKRSQTYRGTEPFSEPESRALRDMFESQSFAAHIDFHSFSQLILYPWTHRREPIEDKAKFAAIADNMSSAMFAAHGEPYKILPGHELNFGASGTLTDWVYGERKTISYTLELRPARGGAKGFVLPPEQIVPTCDEGYAAVTELAEWLIAERAERKR